MSRSIRPPWRWTATTLLAIVVKACDRCVMVDVDQLAQLANYVYEPGTVVRLAIP